MNVDRREDLIGTYFSALDAESFDPLEPIIPDDFTYEHPDLTAESAAEMERFVRSRPPQDTTHSITRCLHTADASVCEGRLTGTLDDGTPREGAFCDVFEFDDDASQITEISVYARR